MARKSNKIPKEEFEELLVEAKEINKFNSINKIKEALDDIKLNSKQQELYKLVESNEIVTILGPAGTSKTFMGLYCSLRFFINNKNAKIFLIKPIVEAGESLGFLPGELTEKTDPYLKSYTDLLNEIIGIPLTKKLFEMNKIIFEPVAYMRGRNLIDAFVIIDECQNYNLQQLMTLVTRKHSSSKFIFIGDYLQDDRFNGKQNPFKIFNDIILGSTKGIGKFQFTTNDIVRDKLIINIIENYMKYIEVCNYDKKYKK